ncbi:hypothetical protein B9Z19DRAFT_1040118 [Tuber borchii]|uniref:Cora-like Mg2+ transporter protein-domain-containing protein n=1 Tax=Tuber borchii TaxID=42251 RepID=A0A2T7A5E7_TUBBO|nr:hypothetical protein B9Z19DRAFT_1040118 [Tuber borchii]
MDHLDTNSSAPLDTNSTPKPSVGSIHQSSQALPQSPASAEESPGHLHGWKTIDRQQVFYDEEGFLYPSCILTSEKLKDRKEDDVVIFNYSLSRTDESPPVEGSSPSSGIFGENDDIFFRVPKDTLIESEQFNQVINPEKEPRLIQSRARLSIIDFPQCYDTYDDNLLNSMAKELHLPNPATFWDAHSKRVLTLPGCGKFRTGFSLRVPSENPSVLAKLGSPEDRITLFVSFPYFGKSTSIITLGPERESVKLLDFKRLGVDAPDHSAVVSEGDVAPGEMLVFQARYMIFDNNTMATFRSKEDSAKDQAPLHGSQERVGAFRAMIQMISNRMDSESWTLGKLQVALCKLEQDIDQMISDEDGQEMERKQKRFQNLLTSLNRLSGGLFAAIAVAERQIAVLQDLHGLFLTSCRTKINDYEKGYPLRQNPFYKNIAPIPILSENSEQIWPNTLDTIDEVVREKRCFITRIEALVENMKIKRKFLSVFLKSGQAKTAETTGQFSAFLSQANTAGTTQEATDAVKRIEDTLKQGQVETILQGRALYTFTVIALMFLPLNFFTSYYGMQTVKEFGGSTATMSLSQFWRTTGPATAGILVLAGVVRFWNLLVYVSETKKERKRQSHRYTV